MVCLVGVEWALGNVYCDASVNANAPSIGLIAVLCRVLVPHTLQFKDKPVGQLQQVHDDGAAAAAAAAAADDDDNNDDDDDDDDDHPHLLNVYCQVVVSLGGSGSIADGYFLVHLTVSATPSSSSESSSSHAKSYCKKFFLNGWIGTFLYLQFTIIM